MRSSLLAFFALAALNVPLAAQDIPPEVTDPNEVIDDWRYSDPVFFWRLSSQPDEGMPGAIPQSEPYLVDDVRIMEGGGFRIVHAVPSQDLVIFCHGLSVPDWDGAFLVNTAIRGLRAESDQ